MTSAEKEIANWIYYEDNNNYYCLTCITERVEEINKNREFSECIDYDNGDTCGFFQDYAKSEEEESPYPICCCKCHIPLLTEGID
ncbi:MAG: hypothetical protein QM768_21665 [Agriterribacter sp.]